MSNPAHAKVSSILKAADVPRLLYLAAACRLWLREHGALRRERNRPGPASRWDWSSRGSPVMR